MRVVISLNPPFKFLVWTPVFSLAGKFREFTYKEISVTDGELKYFLFSFYIS